jgi:hypothetical protein
MSIWGTVIAVVAFLILPLDSAAEPNVAALGCPIRALHVEINAGDVLFTQKPDYVHVLVDVYPYRDVLNTTDRAGMSELALDVVKSCTASKYPSAKLVKLDLVEFLERDSYGAPVWSSVQVLGKFGFARTKGAWNLISL